MGEARRTLKKRATQVKSAPHAYAQHPLHLLLHFEPQFFWGGKFLGHHLWGEYPEVSVDDKEEDESRIEKDGKCQGLGWEAGGVGGV